MDKALPTTQFVKLINKEEFVKKILDENSKTFVVHVASFNLALEIHVDRYVQITSLLTKNVKILDKYSDFTNVFLEEKALML